MKCIFIAIALVTQAATSSFAQGNILIGANHDSIWNDTTGTPVVNNQLYFSLIAGPAATTPSVSSIATFSPTNDNFGYNPAEAWNDILNQSGFFFVDGTNNGPIVGAIGGNGGFAYNDSTGFSSLNLNGGTTNTMYLIAWSTAYATPALAQAANAAVGWSAPFQYTPSSGPVLPNNGISMNSLVTPFGVNIGPVPEPTTVALAGMGGLALFGLRRRG
jgi:hypothetical protein